MAAAVFAVLGAQAQIGQNPIPPYTACTGTGGGTCNLGFVGFIDGPDVTWWWATIYNNACQIIGGVYGNLDCCGPFSIDSQLPYTVDITNLPETGNYNGKLLVTINPSMACRSEMLTVNNN